MKESFGRNKGFGLQVTIPLFDDRKEVFEDKVATAKGVAQANEVRYKEIGEITNDHPDIDKELQVKENTSELLVITRTKKLAAYVITITEKSPKRFRAVFVNRLQNYCLDCLEYLIEANTLRMDSTKNKDKRKDCQHNAFLKLKLMSYMSFLSLESGCILRKQYEQISLQVSDCINLLVAWRKSDATRY